MTSSSRSFRSWRRCASDRRPAELPREGERSVRRSVPLEPPEGTHPLDVLLPHPVDLMGLEVPFVHHPVQMLEGRFGERETRRALLLLAGAVLLDAEPPHERGERETLDDERPEDDGERDEDDEAPRGERPPVREDDRQGERRRERHDAAHPRPADHDDGLPRWVRVGLAVLREQVARKVGAREHPGEAHDDDRPERREALPGLAFTKSTTLAAEVKSISGVV